MRRKDIYPSYNIFGSSEKCFNFCKITAMAQNTKIVHGLGLWQLKTKILKIPDI